MSDPNGDKYNDAIAYVLLLYKPNKISKGFLFAKTVDKSKFYSGFQSPLVIILLNSIS